MIRGVHTMFYSSEPEAFRAFLRDKLGFSGTDVGDGWLIFDLPEADMGCHPADPDSKIGATSGTQVISFYCDDVEKSVQELNMRDKHGDGHQLYIPWFVLAFVAISALNTWLPVNPALHHALVQIDLILLSMAMAALGVDTNLNKLRHLGHRPILLAGLLFLFLMGGGWLLNRWILPFAG